MTTPSENLVVDVLRHLESLLVVPAHCAAVPANHKLT
jgi:hypothetical protein